MIVNCLNRPVKVLARDASGRVDLVAKLRPTEQHPVDELKKRDMYLEAYMGDTGTLIAKGPIQKGSTVSIGAIVTYFDPSTPGAMNTLGQGLPPIEIVNDTGLTVHFNERTIPPRMRGIVMGPQGLSTIPLGFYIENKDGLFNDIRVIEPITHIMIIGMQASPTSSGGYTSMGVSLEDGVDFGVVATGLRMW